MSKLKKWTLLSSIDVSPSSWFPIESRKYLTASGKLINDFTVSNIADVAMVLPITKEGKVVAVRQFKPGINEISLEFPAGRKEKNHEDIIITAQHELEEEVGIYVETDKLQFLGKISGFPTKATEVIFCYLVVDAEFNSQQQLDENEEIDVYQFSIPEFEQLLYSESLIMSSTVACWELAKRKFPDIFGKK